MLRCVRPIALRYHLLQQQARFQVANGQERGEGRCFVRFRQQQLDGSSVLFHEQLRYGADQPGIARGE